MASAQILVATGMRFEGGCWIAYGVNAILYDGSVANYTALSGSLTARFPEYFWTFDHLCVPQPGPVPGHSRSLLLPVPDTVVVPVVFNEVLGHHVWQMSCCKMFGDVCLSACVRSRWCFGCYVAIWCSVFADESVYISGLVRSICVLGHASR